MVVTILEGTIADGREHALIAAYEQARAGPVPRGLVRSELLRDAREPQRWRIQTHWDSWQSLEAMRSSGTPAGVLMFRAADAEPSLTVLNVVASIGDAS
jgi:heme-degrading monooxygenase HmoA